DDGDRDPAIVQAGSRCRRLRRGREESARRDRVQLPGNGADEAEAGVTSLETLFDAIRRRDAAAVKHPLDTEPGPATPRAAGGQAPAIVAIYGRAPEILALLRERGAELDVFEAAAAGDVERVRMLLAADPSLRDAHAPDGWTPLHLAGHFRQTGVIDVLLAHGANVNAVSRNADANAPLHAAAAGGA